MAGRLTLYIDGAAKGNPGHAGIGVIICQEGEVIKNISTYIGTTTNNIAEYTALIYGLQEALIMKAETLTIYTDSQLLFRQLNGQYKVRNSNITNLFRQIQHLLSGLPRVSIEHIPRQQNRGADKLATKAVQQALKKKGILGDVI